ncbi:type IV toxin-antitoxin system AbiEi family antitoxin domain-containing protein [Rhodococcus sp. HNM0569]|uniref:type IV toxin-antitoxin system AbiEi family antitoxin domain-containing protein n=1 Tax=Rhodococcus sp. HNM0569 TaxID=2716340 RepID=UPI00146C816F|nr:type IV toxin-antitoxin system AbiEi family antitoxin domain-containing protein [Rhodococcus sp. HNM0569]NLU82573.1 type IV toxin-antitoxin system AbiEi family antitoxin domain-containing protein [Rhodococcus sp. HNM0569]
MKPTWFEVVKATAQRQQGLIGHAQLAALGIARSQVRHRVESGQWQAVLHGVYSVFTGPLSRAQQLEAALLFGSNGALVSHATAAEIWGWRPVDPTAPVHVTVPYGRSAQSQPPTHTTRRIAQQSLGHVEDTVVHPGVRVHRSRAHNYLGVDAALPLTSRVDTILDVAVDADTPHAAHATVIELSGAAGVTVHRLQARVLERRPRRYNAAIDAAIASLAGGVQSVLEHRYAEGVERAHGLPSARRQAPVRVDGRTLFEDVDYSATGVPLIVRLDGRATHAAAEVAFRDRRRDNAAELAGRPRLVYGYREVVDDACGVADEVEVVLRRGGWIRTTVSPCPRCAWKRRA